MHALQAYDACWQYYYGQVLVCNIAVQITYYFTLLLDYIFAKYTTAFAVTCDLRGISLKNYGIIKVYSRHLILNSDVFTLFYPLSNAIE